jgi:uncharacterized phiE125 gp8 family phage protein
MNTVLYAAPTIEPITLAELKVHLRRDSGTLSDNLTHYQSILPGSHGIHELLTLDVAPGGAGWSAGDTITGVSSGKTCIVVTVLTTKTYIVRDRSGSYTLGEVLTNGTATADQGASCPTFTSGYYLIGAGVDVLGHEAVCYLNAGTNGAGATVDAKIQESDDDITFTDWTGGGFTQVTEATDNAVQEIEYTGTKQWIRIVGKPLVAASEFSGDVVVNEATAADEDLLTSIIQAAREHVEDITRRALLTQTWDYFLQDWPSGDRLRLPFGNLQSVTSISWKDTDGTETTLTAGTDYLVETNGEDCGFIVLPFGCSWPSGTLYPSNPIKVRFVCGWTSAALIPRKIRAAMLLICSDLDVNREGSVQTAFIFKENPAVKNLLASARLPWEFD